MDRRLSSIHFWDWLSTLPIHLLLFQSTSPLLVRVRFHRCGHGDCCRSGGGPSLYRTLDTFHGKVLVPISVELYSRVRVLVEVAPSYRGVSSQRTSHTTVSTSILGVSLG